MRSCKQSEPNISDQIREAFSLWMREHVGKGPSRIKVNFFEDHIDVELSGLLTPLERRFVASCGNKHPEVMDIISSLRYYALLPVIPRLHERLGEILGYPIKVQRQANWLEDRLCIQITSALPQKKR